MRRILVFCALVLSIFPITFVSPATAQACTSSALRPGLTVRVQMNVNLRAAPGTTSRDIGDLALNDLVTLIGGPTCVGGLTWWQVSGQVIGWAAESSGGMSYLAPAPATSVELRAPLDGLRISRLDVLTTPHPADQCPPLNGEIAVNNAGVADPFASGSSTAFFVDGGFSAPLPALCIPTMRVGDATLISPDGSRGRPRILPVEGAPDFVQATLPDAVLLQPGGWALTLGDFLLNVQVTGPFGPMVDSRVTSQAQDLYLAGFAPSESIAVLTGTVTDGAVSELRVFTLQADAHGAAGASIDAQTPIIAAVSESGLIAHPPLVEALGLAGMSNEIDVYDQLVISVWGFEALGLPTPAPATPTAIPEPEPTATATVDSQQSVAANPVVTSVPTGIVNLATHAAPTATPTPADGCTYVVRRGDSFFRIALQHKLTTPQLREANPQVTNTWIIHTGDVLSIPGCGQGLP